MEEEKLIDDLNKNWSRALRKSGDSLVVVRGGCVVFRGKSRGVSDLLYCAKSNLLEGGTVYDTKIGLAVVKISFWFNVSSLYGLLVTKAAKKFCKERKIALRAKNVVEKLYKGTDAGCVLERTAFKSNDIESFIKTLQVTEETKIEKMPTRRSFSFKLLYHFK